MERTAGPRAFHFCNDFHSSNPSDWPSSSAVVHLVLVRPLKMTLFASRAVGVLILLIVFAQLVAYCGTPPPLTVPTNARSGCCRMERFFGLRQSPRCIRSPVDALV